MNFIKALKGRNVIRMARLYLVGAQLLTQVAGTVFPMFGAPEWVARSVLILLAIGFLPALVTAWIFELTPAGLKRESDIEPAQSLTPQPARRMDRTRLMVALLALGYFAVDQLVLVPEAWASPVFPEFLLKTDIVGWVSRAGRTAARASLPLTAII